MSIGLFLNYFLIISIKNDINRVLNNKIISIINKGD